MARSQPIALQNFLMTIRPILRSRSCFVIEIPVPLALFLLRSRYLKARRGEKEVPGFQVSSYAVSF